MIIFSYTKSIKEVICYMFKRLLSVLLAMVLCLSLTVTALAESSDVTLKFTFWGSTVEKKAIESSIAKFTETTGIKVDTMHIPTDYIPKITTMIAGNESPDIGYLSEELAVDWGVEGKLENIWDYMKDDSELKVEDYLDNAWYKWDTDKAVGSSTAIESYIITYNKAAFDEAGIDYPPTTVDTAWTWDQFVDVCKKLTYDANGNHPDDANFDPTNIMQYGVQVDTGIGSYMSFVYGNGGRYITEDGKDFGLNKPAATEALQNIADLMNVYHVAPTPVAAKNIPEISTALQTKKVAMEICGQWSLLDLGNNENLDFGVGVLPVMKDYVTCIVAGATVIFKTSQHKPEAWKLYKWLSDPESAIDLFTSGLWMPLMKDWYTNPDLLARWATGNRAHPDGYVDAVVDTTLNHSMNSPAYNVKHYGEINNIVVAALDQVWLGTKSAQDAMDEIAPEVNKLVDGFYDTSKNF